MDPSDPDPSPTVIPFQYNPTTMTRKLEVQSASDGGSFSEVHRLTGPPIETISVEIELDATDALEQEDDAAVDGGIHAQLAALEMLVYPTSQSIVDNERLVSEGTIEIAPTQGPFTLLIWGRKRVLPVRIADFSITEEAFDPNLNPIRARISISMRVLSYNDLPSSHQGYGLFMAHHVSKEALAATGSVSSLDGVLGATLEEVLSDAG
ncbi:MAG: hypothetical protein H6739_36500 [Alphaproteobacteria bacterium]|nr:hypothetical protein [Alphaproteobacteria bacterium]